MALEDVYRRNLEHRAHRAGWLRAAVLGINDGLVSTASLMVGVATASASLDNASSIIISTGAAGIAAGALSMAVGEYISVSSQTDIENSDRLLEIQHLAIDPEGELEELVEIYKDRGLEEPLARQVAISLTEKDALGAHLRDELGHHPHSKARPVQASIASAVSFALGGLIPFVGALLVSGGAAASTASIALSILGFTVVGLIVAGAVGAKTAGSRLLIPTLRVLIGGCIGMAITAGIGQIFHASVA
jgi:VIT1/CCC1 family predicted Fe2+/Mn2+ transporter